MKPRKIKMIWKDTGKEVTDEKGNPLFACPTIVPKDGITKENYAMFELINEPVNEN